MRSLSLSLRPLSPTGKVCSWVFSMCVKDSTMDLGGRVPGSSSRAAASAPMAAAAHKVADVEAFAPVDAAKDAATYAPSAEGKENSPTAPEGGGWEDVDATAVEPGSGWEVVDAPM